MMIIRDSDPPFLAPPAKRDLTSKEALGAGSVKKILCPIYGLYK